jgi:hypothetical protein
MYPDVAIEDEGLYYEPVDHAALLKDLIVDSADRWPLIEAYRLPEAIKSLPPKEVARLLEQYLPIVLIDAEGEEHRDLYH